MKRFVFVLVVVMIAISVPTVIVYGVESPDELLGKPAPNFTLKLADGNAFELASHKDKDVVVLDFWATWCPPCRRSMPIIVETAGAYAKDKAKPDDGKTNVVFCGINLGESAESVKAFQQATGLKFSAALDSDGAVGSAYGASSIPTTVIVGKDGTVQAVHVGLAPDLKDRLKRELDTLVSGKNLVEPAKAK